MKGVCGKITVVLVSIVILKGSTLCHPRRMANPGSLNHQSYEIRLDVGALQWKFQKTRTWKNLVKVPDIGFIADG